MDWTDYLRRVLTVDTNIAEAWGITRGDFTHTQLTLLRGIAEVHGIRLGLTQTVESEIVGRYQRDLTQALDKLAEPPRPEAQPKREKARDTVLKMVRLWTSRPEFFRGEDKNAPLMSWAIQKFGEQLRQVFPNKLVTPAGAADEGNRREIVRQLPAVESGDGAGKGSRDTVIWMSVLAAAKELGYHRAYFVSRDQKGFGSRLHVDLQREAAEAGAGNLVFYADVDQLIDRLSSPANMPEPIEKILARPEVIRAVRYLLNEGNFRLEIADWVPNSSEAWTHWSDNDQLTAEPRNDDTRVVRVGEHTMVAITRIWRVRRMFPGKDGQPPCPFEFTIQLGMLAVYSYGELASAKVVSAGGIWGADHQLVGEAGQLTALDSPSPVNPLARPQTVIDS